MEKKKQLKKIFDKRYTLLVNHLLRIEDPKKLKKIALKSYNIVIKKYPLFAQDLAERFGLDLELIKAAEFKFNNSDIESKIRQSSKLTSFLRHFHYSQGNYIMLEINAWLREERRKKEIAKLFS